MTLHDCAGPSSEEAVYVQMLGLKLISRAQSFSQCSSSPYSTMMYSMCASLSLNRSKCQNPVCYQRVCS